MSLFENDSGFGTVISPASWPFYREQRDWRKKHSSLPYFPRIVIKIKSKAAFLLLLFLSRSSAKTAGLWKSRFAKGIAFSKKEVLPSALVKIIVWFDIVNWTGWKPDRVWYSALDTELYRCHCRMHSGGRSQIPGSFSKDLRAQLQHFPLNSVEGALGTKKTQTNKQTTKKGWLQSKPLLHSGIDFKPFHPTRICTPSVKGLSDSSDPSGDRHLTEAGKGFLSCVQPEELLATPKQGIHCENLASFNWFCYLWTEILYL